jgi:hypothetical protein
MSLSYIFSHTYWVQMCFIITFLLHSNIWNLCVQNLVKSLWKKEVNCTYTDSFSDGYMRK